MRKKPDASPKGGAKGLSALAKRFAAFRPARDVLTHVVAVPTRFVQIDFATRVWGWPIQRSAIIHGPSNEGKALRNQELILTPTGWSEIGKLKVGDLVIGGDGKSCRVIGTYPQGPKQLFRVRFSDGAEIEACAEHRWLTRTAMERQLAAYERGPRPARKRIPTGKEAEFVVRTTEELASDLAADHEVPMVGPVEYSASGEKLPLDPYALGLLLGDGSFGSSIKFTKPEPDVREALASRLGTDALKVLDPMNGESRITGGQTLGAIRELGLSGHRSWEKFVPESYMRAPARQRMELLRGLVDTDGSVVKDGGAIEFCSSSPRLFSDFVELARSLGALVSTTSRPSPRFTYKGEQKIGRPSWRARMSFVDDTKPFASKKHESRWTGRTKAKHRRIVGIVPSCVDEATCIAVDSPDHTFVARSFVVTHNTAFAIGLLGSFVEAGGMAHLVDAERTTTETWLKQMIGDTSASDRFIAARPASYEACVNETREFFRGVSAARLAGELPEHASAVSVVDSLRKLVPEDFMKKIQKHGAGGEKGSVDGMGGRGAQIRAALNAAWLDELIPLIDETRCAWVAIARESEDPDADAWSKKFGTDYKVQGGKAIVYDAALRCRIERAGWTSIGEGPDKTIIGERHKFTILKTKVGAKEGRASVAYFHTSNGTISPLGFDRARDVIELAKKFGIVTTAGSWSTWKGEKWGSHEKMVAALNDCTGDLETLEAEVRTKFAEHDPEEEDADAAASPVKA